MSDHNWQETEGARWCARCGIIETEPSAFMGPCLLGAQFPRANENDIKVMLDGNFLRISAVIDSAGAKKLIEALDINMALLENGAEEQPPAD